MNPDMGTTTYHLQFAGSFGRIMADDGAAKREIAQCSSRGQSWSQAVRDAEVIVAALNAYPKRREPR